MSSILEMEMEIMLPDVNNGTRPVHPIDTYDSRYRVENLIQAEEAAKVKGGAETRSIILEQGRYKDRLNPHGFLKDGLIASDEDEESDEWQSESDGDNLPDGDSKSEPDSDYEKRYREEHVLECPGCRDDLANQHAHMGINGCLFMPWEDRDRC